MPPVLLSPAEDFLSEELSFLFVSLREESFLSEADFESEESFTLELSQDLHSDVFVVLVVSVALVEDFSVVEEGLLLSFALSFFVFCVVVVVVVVVVLELFFAAFPFFPQPVSNRPSVAMAATIFMDFIKSPL